MKKSIHFIIYIAIIFFSSCLPEGGESSIYLPANGEDPPREEASVIPASFDFGDYGGVVDTPEDIFILDTIVTLSRLVNINFTDRGARNVTELLSFYTNGEDNLPEQIFFKRNMTRNNLTERIELKNSGYNYFVLIAETGSTINPVVISFKVNEVTFYLDAILNVGKPVGIVVKTI